MKKTKKTGENSKLDYQDPTVGKEPKLSDDQAVSDPTKNSDVKIETLPLSPSDIRRVWLKVGQYF